ncbi:MAG: hypothetical protein KGL39_37190 [Patescibacteria group bacterium]|nr:hypothetical protein [Patescibacteria group bacterium]
MDYGVSIVVADRGFVYVGEVASEGDFLVVRRAWNIRYWGTTKGLGELVDGPIKDKTKLDEVGVVRIPLRAVISIIAVDQDAWKPVI